MTYIAPGLKKNQGAWTKDILGKMDSWKGVSWLEIQEGLAVASIARDDPSTLPGDDPFPRARMQRDRNAR